MSKADIAPQERWREALATDDVERAWDLFIGQYRALIFATIRHYTQDQDETMDVFAEVCEGLRRDRLARLQRYWDQPTHTARFSTWLVTVVRHQVIDWLRQHAFRRRPRLPELLSPLQRRIFELVFLERRSHVETYELVHSTVDRTLSFSAFVRELRVTYRAAEAGRGATSVRELAASAPLPMDDNVDAAGDEFTDPAVLLDTRLRIVGALSSLKPDERLAVEMFVVYEMPAATIARALRWPNAKAVYNRVYRALAALRASLQRQGLRREDW